MKRYLTLLAAPIILIAVGSFVLGRLTAPKQKLVPVILNVARTCVDYYGDESLAQRISLTQRPVYFDPKRGMVAAAVPSEESFLIQFRPCPSDAVASKFYAGIGHQ